MDRHVEDGEDLPVPLKRGAAGIAKPPHPLDGKWHIHVEGETFGPYTGHELKAFAEEGRVERDTQVCRHDAQDWVDAGQAPTLKRMFPVSERTALSATRAAPRVARGGAQAGDNGTVVQVTNNIHAPGIVTPYSADKSPGLALFLSFIFCGLGQLYNGDVGKGIVMFFACVFLWFFFLGWIINLWSIIDAYSRANEMRSRHHAWLAAAAARPA